jgi:diacylglycerol kinase family enzyme
MKIDLVHNPTAGDGQDVDGLVSLITDAGHKVRHRSTKDDWKALLQDPGDLVVAAGGDGTVRKVALAAADHGVPFAVLPIGTANNIAKTLGMLGEAAELVESWAGGSGRPFDIGEVVAPWGRERFVESVGGGPAAELITRGSEVGADAGLLGRETDRALHLLSELVRNEDVRHWQVTADDVDLSGDYLAVELLNIMFVGPNVPLAPAADPGDGLLDVALVSEADRGPLLSYLADRLSLASGQLPSVRVERARRIKLVAPAGARLHLDDAAWPSERPLADATPMTVRCLAGAATLGGAGESGSPEER